MVKEGKNTDIDTIYSIRKNTQHLLLQSVNTTKQHNILRTSDSSLQLTNDTIDHISDEKVRTHTSTHIYSDNCTCIASRHPLLQAQIRKQFFAATPYYARTTVR